MSGASDANDNHPETEARNHKALQGNEEDQTRVDLSLRIFRLKTTLPRAEDALPLVRKGYVDLDEFARTNFGTMERRLTRAERVRFQGPQAWFKKFPRDHEGRTRLVMESGANKL